MTERFVMRFGMFVCESQLHNKPDSDFWVWLSEVTEVLMYCIMSVTLYKVGESDEQNQYWPISKLSCPAQSSKQSSENIFIFNTPF